MAHKGVMLRRYSAPASGPCARPSAAERSFSSWMRQPWRGRRPMLMVMTGPSAEPGGSGRCGRGSVQFCDFRVSDPFVVLYMIHAIPPRIHRTVSPRGLPRQFITAAGRTLSRFCWRPCRRTHRSTVSWVPRRQPTTSAHRYGAHMEATVPMHACAACRVFAGRHRHRAVAFRACEQE